MYLYAVPVCKSETQSSVIHWAAANHCCTPLHRAWVHLGGGGTGVLENLSIFFVIHSLLDLPRFLETLALFLLEETSKYGTA